MSCTKTLLSVNTDNLETEILPKTPQAINQVLNLYGKNYKDGQIITLSFGYSGVVTKQLKLQLTKQINKLPKLGKLWGENKINYLQIEGDANKKEIIALSKEFNIISNYTSMIVLDDVRDYVRYNIKPPADLQEKFNKLINKKVAFSVESSTDENRGDLTVNGVVSDKMGPLPGVSILVKGTSRSTETNFDGEYSISVKRGDILQFSYIGMNIYEIHADSHNVNLLMQTSKNSVLDEVIITGYCKKIENKSSGYAVSRIESKDIINSGNKIFNALAGKISGVQITQTSGSVGASTNIRLRGINSFAGSNKPLIIIDGIPINNSEKDPLNLDFLGLDPNSIKSISVIKGIKAAVLYGVRSVNGVIIINTKDEKPYYSETQNNQESIPNPIKKNRYKGKLELSKPVAIAYIDSFNKLKTKGEFYKHYLTQRDNYLNHPAYFIDIYDLFNAKGFNELAELIISNIVEIDTDNYEQLKVYAYKMEVSNQVEKAAFIYKKILKLRSEDAQSFRDLALIYYKMGHYKESEKILDNIVSGRFYNNNQRRNFSGLNAISKNEILHVRNKYLNDKPNKKRDEYDVRILIDWNHNDTDIDLHVIDPTKEECFYSNTTTKIGGEMSEDMTEGFGPEEYTLKKAKKGNYFIKVNYFSDNYQKIENPTFLKVTIFKNYGKSNESAEQKIVRLDNNEDNMIIHKLTY